MTQYPKAVTSQSGCKVGWLFYYTREEAEQAAQVAKKKAAEKYAMGYDFGYQSPGAIQEFKVKDSDNKIYRVVIP